MEDCEDYELRELINTVSSACHAIPRKESLASSLADVQAAQERGYFFPDEDERLREFYCLYLRTRATLLDAIAEIEPLVRNSRGEVDELLRLKCFAVGFAAACVLVRSASFVVDLAERRFLVWKKLDEAEMRYGIPRRTFTDVYKNLVSGKRMWRFYESVRYFEGNDDAVMNLEGDGIEEILGVIEEERSFIVKSRSSYLKRGMKYRMFSFLRRHHSGYRKVMFHLFRFSGSAIAEMKRPLISAMKAGKRVTPRVLLKAKAELMVGDVLITRHDDAMSNLFLPGFWPHGALYIGDEEQRVELGLNFNVDPSINVIESKKDGVKFRELEETLAVDAFVVLRPTLSAAGVKIAIEKAVSHVGKRYDFLFDFSSADRLACTELIYRSYHAVEGVDFRLDLHAGRKCMSAESLLNQVVARGWFEPVLIYGVSGIKVHQGVKVREILEDSYESEWGADAI